MNYRTMLLLLLLLFIFAGCAPVSNTNLPNNSDSPPGPTDTHIPVVVEVTPTPTTGDQVLMVTPQPHNIVLTAVNLQLDDNQIRLTEAAVQIETLSAESATLEARLAAAKTQTAGSSGDQNNNSQNSNNGGDYSNLPSNVYIVVTVDQATLFISKRDNDKGVPIMEPYEPRVKLPPGTRGWVYKTPVKSDGGTIFYESFDPDGKTPDFKIYFKSNHIQIRPKNASPNPGNYPGSAARAEVIERFAVHKVVGKDDKGKPIMDTYKPFIHYDPGDRLVVYPDYVVATGGSQWYPIYDPDGQPSGYIHADKIAFPQFWD